MTRILLLLCLYGWICLAQTSDPSAIGVSGPYRVGPGDVLEIAVFEVEELSGPAVVSPRGTISPPLIPELRVDGMTTLEIGEKLKQRYSENYLRNPQISVSVAQFRSQPFSILGAVRHPGVYQLQGRRRLVDVLAMAGGFTPEAGETVTISRRNPAAEAEPPRPEAARALRLEAGASRLPVHLSGGDAEEIRVSIRELLSRPDAERANPVIQPHDVVQVDKAGIVYVAGAVDRPGGFPVKDQERMTVLRAVSLASGLGRSSAPQKARILREVDGVRSELPVRIKDILSGKTPDVELRANDVLYIPDSRAKSALSRGAEAAIQLGTGLAIWRR